MSELNDLLRAALKQHSRLLSRRQLAEAIGVLREFLKPSEQFEEEKDLNVDWLYFEYRRAKAVEHSLLKERAIRRKRLRKDPSKTVELRLEEAHDRIRALEIAIRKLLGLLQAQRLFTPPTDLQPVLAAAILEASAAAGEDIKRLDAEALLLAEVAREADSVCHAVEHLITDPTFGILPPRRRCSSRAAASSAGAGRSSSFSTSASAPTERSRAHEALDRRDDDEPADGLGDAVAPV